MSKAYTADGRRRSSMTHAKRPHVCQFCGDVVFGNGGKVSHGRKHVRRGEAREFYRAWTGSRVFLAPADVKAWLARFPDFEEVTP